MTSSMEQYQIVGEQERAAAEKSGFWVADHRRPRTKPIGAARWIIAGACMVIAAAAFTTRPMVAAHAKGGLADRSNTEVNAAVRAPQGASRHAGLRHAERLTLRELSSSPARADAWTRLAYIRAVAGGGLTPQATQALLTSYKVAPYDGDLMLWRTAFVFGAWSQASPPLRDAAFEEANAFGQFNAQRAALAKIPPLIEDPSGRFALMLALEGAPGG